MKITPRIEELEDPSSYEKVLTLPYSEIAPFVLNHLAKPSIPMLTVWILSGASLFLTVWFWPGLKFPSAGLGIAAGLATGVLLLPLLLIPVHEGLHLIPFRLAGAKDIRFGADPRQGIIYVTAHRFVAGTGLFSLVAIIPLVTVTVALLVLILLSPAWWKWTLSVTLFVHTTMCAGDTALMGYMNSFAGRMVYTWDDADRKVAYFYASKQAGIEG
jgi:hypothetical protein